MAHHVQGGVFVLRPQRYQVGIVRVVRVAALAAGVNADAAGGVCEINDHAP